MSTRGFFAIGLDGAKTTVNIASTLRSAYNYGAAFVAVSGKRYARHPVDTPRGYRHVPLFHDIADLHDLVPFDCVPVAVDLVPYARSLVEYTHPERAFYVFGAEDATLGPRVLAWCRDVVCIPTRSCVNLSCAVAAVLYDRCAKRGEWPAREGAS